MAWSRAQHAAGGSGSASSFALAFGVNNTAGNLLIVAVSSFGAGITVTVTDSQGNTYTQAGSYATNGSNRVSIWYCSSAKAGANTVTATFSGTVLPGMVIAEYGGDGAGATLDGVPVTASGGSTTSPNVGTIAVSGSNEMAVLAACQGSNNLAGTAGAGFTLFDSDPNGAGNEACYAEDDMGISAGVTGAMTISGNPAWAAIGAAFKPAGGGGAPANTNYNLLLLGVG